MIEVTVLDKQAARYKKSVLSAAKIFLAALKKEKTSLEIFLIGDKEMSKNVLAFPADASFPRPDITEPALGEIFLNPKYIAEHNEDLMHMLAHGILHLLGHDHEIDRDRMKMEAKERELLTLLQRE